MRMKKGLMGRHHSLISYKRKKTVSGLFLYSKSAQNLGWDTSCDFSCALLSCTQPSKWNYLEMPINSTLADPTWLCQLGLIGCTTLHNYCCVYNEKPFNYSVSISNPTWLYNLGLLL